jgi:VWFA-related protein
VYVLVFDESHILPGHEVGARLAAERFLRTSIRPGDRVGLYALPGPGPQIEFTSDVQRILRELTAVRGVGEETGTGAMGTMRTYEAYEIARGNQQILERQVTLVQSRLRTDTRAGSSRVNPATDFEDPSAVRRALLEDARAFVARADDESRRFLVRLADVVRALRTVDGRKAVVLFSEGFQVDNLTHELEAVAAAAAQSYSVIYSLDVSAHGVEASDDTARGGERMTEIRDKVQPLGSLSAETGGTFVIDSAAQRDRSLARIADMTEDYYLVGFTPATAERDRGQYRRIRVTVSRAGARVSTRTGYTPDSNASPADARKAIDAALRAPFAKQEIAIEYTTYVLRGATPSTARVIMSLAAQLPAVSAASQAADVVYVVRDVETGTVAASGSGRMAVAEAPRDNGATSGTSYHRVQFDLRPGTYMMRAVVREPGGLLGSADRRFEVRALDGPDITASDLVIGSADVSGLPVRAQAYVPGELTCVLEVYSRTPAQLENVSVIADLVPLTGEPVVVSARADLGPVKAVNAGAARAVRVSLPLARIAPGEYLVRATLRKDSDTVTELVRDVTVRPGLPSSTATEPNDAARVHPLIVLQGDVARRLVDAIQARVKGTALDGAARAAAAGNWAAVNDVLRSLASTSTDASILRGMAALAKADYTGAVAAFREVQSVVNGEPLIAFIVGWAHTGSGDHPAAITAWRNAVHADATFVPAYLALVDVYQRLGHPELARQVLEAGLRALPGSPELREQLERMEKR